MKFVNEPTFCPIAPIGYSPLVKGANAHLVLAHLLDKEFQPEELHSQVDQYIQFVKAESAAGAFIIMDNSCYEYHKPHEPAKLLELADLCDAHAIVLPDYPFSPSQKTIDAAIEYASSFKQAGYKTFFVPQSETGDVEDWISAYEWAANSELIDIIGISILGVPNAWNLIDPAYSRVVAMQTLLDRGLFNQDKHHHFLGLNSGPALEIPTLLRMGVLDTIDSSGPVWAGINSHRYSTDYDSYQSVKKLKMVVDFFAPVVGDSDTTLRIIHNLQLTNSLFDKKVIDSGVKPWYAIE